MSVTLAGARLMRKPLGGTCATLSINAFYDRSLRKGIVFGLCSDHQMMISQLFAHFRRRFRPPTTIFWRWLGLTIAGLVAYVLLRALWTVIELGTLLADWQWYVPLSLCLILLPIRLSWQWPSGRLAWLAFGGALVWLLTGYAGFGASEHLQVAGTPPIRISYWAYTDFRHMPESVLADLHATHATLYLHAPTTSFEDVNAADLTTGLQRLATYQI